MRRFLVAPLLAALVLLVPLGAAQEDPWKRRACTSQGCAQTDDADEDGHPDWVNVALVAEDLVFLNANLNRTNVSWWGGVTTEEYEALHGPDDQALGADAWGYANLTSPEGGPGFNDTEVNALVFRTDHETGAFEVVAERTVYEDDPDDDNVPGRRPDLLP